MDIRTPTASAPDSDAPKPADPMALFKLVNSEFEKAIDEKEAFSTSALCSSIELLSQAKQSDTFGHDLSNEMYFLYLKKCYVRIKKAAEAGDDIAKQALMAFFLQANSIELPKSENINEKLGVRLATSLAILGKEKYQELLTPQVILEIINQVPPSAIEIDLNGALINYSDSLPIEHQIPLASELLLNEKSAHAASSIITKLATLGLPLAQLLETIIIMMNAKVEPHKLQNLLDAEILTTSKSNEYKELNAKFEKIWGTQFDKENKNAVQWITPPTGYTEKPFGFNECVEFLINPPAIFDPLKHELAALKEFALKQQVPFVQLIHALEIQEKKPEESFNLIRAAAEGGNFHAQYLFAFMIYRANKNFTMDYKALGADDSTYLGRTISTLLKEPKVQATLTRDYCHPRAEKYAFQYLCELPTIPQTLNIRRLNAYLFLHCKPLITIQDDDRCQKLLELIEQSPDGETLFQLARHHLENNLLPINAQIAFQYIKRASMLTIKAGHIIAYMINKDADDKFISAELMTTPGSIELHKIGNKLLENPQVKESIQDMNARLFSMSKALSEGENPEKALEGLDPYSTAILKEAGIGMQSAAQIETKQEERTAQQINAKKRKNKKSGRKAKSKENTDNGEREYKEASQLLAQPIITLEDKAIAISLFETAITKNYAPAKLSRAILIYNDIKVVNNNELALRAFLLVVDAANANISPAKEIMQVMRDEVRLAKADARLRAFLSQKMPGCEVIREVPESESDHVKMAFDLLKYDNVRKALRRFEIETKSKTTLNGSTSNKTEQKTTPSATHKQEIKDAEPPKLSKIELEALEWIEKAITINVVDNVKIVEQSSPILSLSSARMKLALGFANNNIDCKPLDDDSPPTDVNFEAFLLIESAAVTGNLRAQVTLAYMVLLTNLNRINKKKPVSIEGPFFELTTEFLTASTCLNSKSTQQRLQKYQNADSLKIACNDLRKYFNLKNEAMLQSLSTESKEKSKLLKQEYQYAISKLDQILNIAISLEPRKDITKKSSLESERAPDQSHSMKEVKIAPIQQEVTSFDSLDPLYSLKVLVGIDKRIKFSKDILQQLKSKVSPLFIQPWVGTPSFWNSLCEIFLHGDGLQFYKKMQDLNLVTTIFGTHGKSYMWRTLEWNLGELDKQYKFDFDLDRSSPVTRENREAQLCAWFIVKEMKPYQHFDAATIYPIASRLGIPQFPNLCQHVENLYFKLLEIALASTDTQQSADVEAKKTELPHPIRGI